MKCLYSGIRLFLRSQCSQLLYNLKRSAYVFVSLLDYSQLSRLKIRLICFLFSLFLLFCSPALGINKVYADETPTPNPTFAPIYVTATPRPHQFSSCPEYGNPVGYGSVTPSANWNLWCSQCLPFDGYSQPLPEGWPTQAPQITPTPTLDPGDTDEARITSSNTSFFYEVGDYPNYVTAHEETDRYIKVEDHVHYSNWLPWTIYGWNDTNDAQYVENFDYRIVYQHEAMSSAYCGYTLKFGIKLRSLNVDETKFTFTGDIEGEYTVASGEQIIWFYEGRVCDAALASVEFNVQIEVEESRGQAGYDWYITEDKNSYMLGYNSTQVEFEWYKGSTDTGQVIVDSYCNEIEAQAEFDMNGIFDFPTIGIADCIEIGGQTLGFGWLHTLFGEALESVPEELTLPGFNLCLIPINFGAINIFGLSIDLDAMAVVMAGVTLLRYIFRR